MDMSSWYNLMAQADTHLDRYTLGVKVALRH